MDNLFPTAVKALPEGSSKALYDQLAILEADTSYGQPNMTSNLITMQSNSAARKEVVATSNSIYASLKERTKTSSGAYLSDAQLRAGTYATMLSANPKEFFKQDLRQVGTMESRNMNPATPANRMKRMITQLSYNESDFRKMSRQSVTYSMQASSQDALGNLFFKPIAFDPLTTGVETDISIVNLYNNAYRSTTGNLTNFHRKNLLEAYVNPEIVRNETTRMLCVYRPNGTKGANENIFVDPNLVPIKTRRVGAGITLKTGSIKIGQEFEFTGVSQREDMLAGGVADFTDTISPVIRLDYFDLKVGEDVLRINTYELRDSMFYAAAQGRTTNVLLTFDNDSITIKNNSLSLTEKPDGTRKPLVTLAKYKDYDIRIRVQLNGKVSLDGGTSSVNKGADVEFVNALDSDGRLVTDAGVLSDLADIFSKAEPIGWVPEARFDNWNLRNLGLLVETQNFKVLYNVPYLSPVSSIVNTYDDENAAPQVLSDLITVTQLTSSHAAIAKLRNAEAYLENFARVPDANGNEPEFHGIGGYYLKAFYHKDTFKLLSIIDSTESHNRTEDIRCALWNRIHYRAMRMILDSEYLPAARRLTGDQNYKPTVIIGTDPMIASYLFGEGETRVYPKREQYDVVVETSLSALAVGKLWMSLAHNAKAATDNELCPLSFGNFLTGADVIARHDRSWNGQISNTLTTTPRYLHVWNLPILSVMNIEDIEAVSGKAYVNVEILGGKVETTVTP